VVSYHQAPCHVEESPEERKAVDAMHLQEATVSLSVSNGGYETQAQPLTLLCLKGFPSG
jgi:hypothetical protein